MKYFGFVKSSFNGKTTINPLILILVNYVYVSLGSALTADQEK